MDAWADDDADSTGVPGARRVKDVHAGPNSAPSCLSADHVRRIGGQARLRQNKNVQSFLPCPPKHGEELGRGQALHVESQETERGRGWVEVHWPLPAGRGLRTEATVLVPRRGAR